MNKKQRKKRVVILGDSLSMPRDSDNVFYEETYPYLLDRHSNIDVICRSKRSNDTTKQAQAQNLYDDLICFQPDVVIIHLGIVDCAPRLFGRTHSFILNFLPLLIKNLYINVLSRHRYLITKTLKTVYVNKNDFKKNLNKIISNSTMMTEKVYCIAIAPTNSQNKTRSYGFESNINEYNDIIRTISSENNVDYIDFYNECKEEYLLDDGIHLNALGHYKIYEEIFSNVTHCDNES